MLSVCLVLQNILRLPRCIGRVIVVFWGLLEVCWNGTVILMDTLHPANSSASWVNLTVVVSVRDFSQRCSAGNGNDGRIISNGQETFRVISDDNECDNHSEIVKKGSLSWLQEPKFDHWEANGDISCRTLTFCRHIHQTNHHVQRLHCFATVESNDKHTVSHYWALAEMIDDAVFLGWLISSHKLSLLLCNFYWWGFYRSGFIPCSRILLFTCCDILSQNQVLSLMTFKSLFLSTVSRALLNEMHCVIETKC